ncbi:MAG: hypothetical protein AB7U78_01090 [Hyphomicrobiaceae bacterium]
MSLPAVAALIVLMGGADVPAPQGKVQLAQSTNPALRPPERFGRSYAPPEQSNPGTSSGPLLTTPRPTSPSTPRSRQSEGLPNATDCAAGYSRNSGLTRREFNRLCGHGS